MVSPKIIPRRSGGAGRSGGAAPIKQIGQYSSRYDCIDEKPICKESDESDESDGSDGETPGADDDGYQSPVYHPTQPSTLQGEQPTEKMKHMSTACILKNSSLVCAAQEDHVQDDSAVQESGFEEEAISEAWTDDSTGGHLAIGEFAVQNAGAINAALSEIRRKQQNERLRAWGLLSTEQKVSALSTGWGGDPSFSQDQAWRDHARYVMRMISLPDSCPNWFKPNLQDVLMKMDREKLIGFKRCINYLLSVTKKGKTSKKRKRQMQKASCTIVGCPDTDTAEPTPGYMASRKMQRQRNHFFRKVRQRVNTETVAAQAPKKKKRKRTKDTEEMLEQKKSEEADPATEQVAAEAPKKKKRKRTEERLVQKSEEAGIETEPDTAKKPSAEPSAELAAAEKPDKPDAEPSAEPATAEKPSAAKKPDTEKLHASETPSSEDISAIMALKIQEDYHSMEPCDQTRLHGTVVRVNEWLANMPKHEEPEKYFELQSYIDWYAPLNSHFSRLPQFTFFVDLVFFPVVGAHQTLLRSSSGSSSQESKKITPRCKPKRRNAK